MQKIKLVLEILKYKLKVINMLWFFQLLFKLQYKIFT